MTTKRRVLIIDDETGFTRLLKLNLHHTGRYAAEVVNEPGQALQVADKFQPDVILLDVMMPSMDGGEVANQIRSIPSLRRVPIIFLTALAKKVEIHSHQGLIGGLPFVAKPVELSELIECIERQLAPA